MLSIHTMAMLYLKIASYVCFLPSPCPLGPHDVRSNNGRVEPLPLLGCYLVNHTVHLQPHDCNYCVFLLEFLTNYLETQ